MSKLISGTENMFKELMYEYYFRFVNYCKYKKTWMLKAKEIMKEIIKHDTILTKLTLMD